MWADNNLTTQRSELADDMTVFFKNGTQVEKQTSLYCKASGLHGNMKKWELMAIQHHPMGYACNIAI